MVRAAQYQFSDLQVIKKLTRDKYPLLKPVLPTQITLACCGLVDASKGGFGGLYMPNEGSCVDRVHPKMSHTISFSGMYRKSFIYRRNRNNSQKRARIYLLI